MVEEISIKTDDFWRLLQREQFIAENFGATLRYRIPEKQVDEFYIDVICTSVDQEQYAQGYINAYLYPKHQHKITIPIEAYEIIKEKKLLPSLMKEYVVHIESTSDSSSVDIGFYSLDLVVLYLVLDHFDKSMKTAGNFGSTVTNASDKILSLITNDLKTHVSAVDDSDKPNSEVKPAKTDMKLKKAAAPSVSPVPKKKSKDDNKNDLIKELRKKLAGRNLLPIIIDGANVGTTYGEGTFSAKGIKIVVDYFKDCGYPDDKIVAIIPAHYVSKGPADIITDLKERRILIQAFHQKIDNKMRRFYDDRMIIDTAVVKKGVIISNDFYRDITKTAGVAVQNTIRNRLLCYRFIGDDLLLPNPVGEDGVALDKFLTT